MVNKRKIRLTEKELEQFIGEIVDSVMINEQADGGQTEWYGTPLNKDGFITYKEKGGNRISFMSSRGIDGDNRINKMIDSGKWGYNPYDQPQKGITAGALVNLKAYYKKDLPFGRMSDSDMALRDGGPQIPLEGKINDKCPKPKPIPRPNLPKLKVGDLIDNLGVFKVTEIRKSFHSESDVEIYKSRGGVEVYADNVLSAWDSEAPLNIKITIDRVHKYDTPPSYKTIDFGGDIGVKTIEYDDGFSSEEAGFRGQDAILIKTSRKQISGLKGGIDRLREKTGVDLIDVEIGKFAGDNSRGYTLDITVNNQPDLWTEAYQYGSDEATVPNKMEWGRKGCNLYVEADVDFAALNPKKTDLYRNYERATENNNNLYNRREELRMKWLQKNGGAVGIDVNIKANYRLDVMGQQMRTLMLVDTPYDESTGEWLYTKSNWNPLNWSVHVWLDIVAVAGLIVAGFFTGGVAWSGVAVYVGANLVNAALYVSKGEYGMAALFLILDFIPAGKLTKGLKTVFKAGKAPIQTLKAVSEMTQILYKGGAGKFNTLRKMATTNPESLQVMRAVAELGEEGLKSFKQALKNAKTSKIGKQEVGDFLKALRQSDDEMLKKLGRELNEKEAARVVKQQRNVMVKYFEDLLNSGTILQTITEAAAVISIWDVNLPIMLLDEYLLDKPLKERKQVKSLSDRFTRYMSKKFAGETWLDDFISKTTKGEIGGSIQDIVNSTPFTKNDLSNEQKAKNLFNKTSANLIFYDWSVDDEYWSWKSPDYGKGIKYQYSAATSNDLITNNGQRLVTDCEFIDPEHKGITQKHKVGSHEFNSALKDDWVENGWRPGYCVATQSQVNRAVSSTLLPEEGSEEMFEILTEEYAKNLYPNFFAPASENYKQLTTRDGIQGSYWKITIGGKTYTITPETNDRFIEAVVRLPDEARIVIMEVMFYLLDLKEPPTWEIDENTGKAIPNFGGELKALNQYKGEI